MKTIRSIFLAWPSTAIAQQGPGIVKIPCRDMGDGRTLIDPSCLPD
jgi:hypothetical protein